MIARETSRRHEFPKPIRKTTLPASDFTTVASSAGQASGFLTLSARLWKR
jgi:hypothetical protein